MLFVSRRSCAMGSKKDFSTIAPGPLCWTLVPYYSRSTALDLPGLLVILYLLLIIISIF